MMEDTPSNYNIANGRLEGKSMGLKAILLYAKNQGIQLGTGGLPQIQEESNALTPNPQLVKDGGMHSSGEQNSSQWKNINMPMGGAIGRTQIVAHDEMNFGNNRTLEHDNKQSRGARSKRNPGVTKQFLEPSEMTDRAKDKDIAKIKSNNFL